MKKILLSIHSALFSVLCCASVPIKFEKKERVVLVGPTFVERMARFGYLETALTLAMPDKEITFRNLGWSADTVKGASRGYEKPQAGYANLLKKVRENNPTLLLLAYGPAESWDGKLETFALDYQKLIDDLKPTGARIALLSPILQENWGDLMPDPTPHNSDLRAHAMVIEGLADKNGLAHLDLLDFIRPTPEPLPEPDRLTMNSLHLKDKGHRALAKHILTKLNLPLTNFDSLKANLIRSLIKQKNELHFHSWRPQNQTYLLSFRRHEQGRHAQDLPKFTPLVEEKEHAIRKLVATPEDKIKRPPVAEIPSARQPIKPSEKALADLKTLHVPDDLKLNVFASEPAIKNPVQSAWDERGRLWVATAESYPHIAPGFLVDDKIVILEDQDGDGVADHRTLFADNLLMPTAVLPGHGGVYVGTSTEILHLRDTDGDGRADQKTILLSGLGTEDTHHVVHGLRHTEDGRIGFTQSIYINTHVETPHGVRRLLKSGIWTFDPHTHDLEIFAYGLVNPWGHETDEYGQSFLTDGAGGAGIHYAFPGAAYVTSAYHSRSEVLPGLNPGQPKHCGLAIIQSRLFPEKYRGLLVTNDFRGHRTLSFRLSDHLSGFHSAQQQDLVHAGSKGTDRHGSAGSYRPVDVDEGPDGALYFTDWSNPIIQHGEVDFHDKRRDHEHGRILRLLPKEPKTKPFAHKKLATKKTDDWLDALASPHLFLRRAARRLLVEHADASVPPKLLAQAKTSDNDLLLLERVRSLLSLRSEVPVELFRRLAQSEDPRIRASALRLGHLTPDAIDDPHPRVRLEAVCALRKQGDLPSVETFARAFDQPTDRNLDFALRQSLRDLRPVWEGKTTFGNQPARLSRVVALTGSQAPLNGLLQAITSDKLATAKRPAALRALAGAARQPKHLSPVLGAILSEKTSANTRRDLLQTLLDTPATRNLTPPKERALLAKLHRHPELCSLSLRLAARWKQPGAREIARELLANTPADNLPALRRNAATLAAFGKTGTNALLSFAENTESSEAELAALEAVAETAPVEAAKLAYSFLASSAARHDLYTLYANIIRSAEAPKILATSLQGKTLPKHAAIAGIRAATTSGRNLSGLVAALRKAGKLKPMRQQLSPQEMKEVVGNVENHGNPALGELIYRQKALACVACHAIGGSGPQVGPDLVSIGASAPIDYLVESLLQPNKKIKEGFHMTIVNSKDNKAFAGLELSSGKGMVVIRDASGKIIEIPTSQVKSKSIVPTSFMPAGLTSSLTSEEFVHLVAFLSKLGKEGSYRFPKETYVRTVEIPSTDAARVMKRTNNFVEHPAERSKKLLALVNGSIPLAEIPESPGGLRHLRFHIQAAEPEEIRLTFNETRGLTAQIQRKPIRLQPIGNFLKRTVQPGSNLFLFTITPDFPAEHLQIQLHSNSPKITLLN